MPAREYLAIVLSAVYAAAIVVTVIQIIYDTRNPVKSLSYITLTLFVPLLGMIIYYSFGQNYRKRNFYRRKKIEDWELFERLKHYIDTHAEAQLQRSPELFGDHESTVKMLLKDGFAPLSSTCGLKLLVNGEEKFPELIRRMEAATDHIHLEYYIYNDDRIGNTLKQIMIRKAQQGVRVRFIFDDFGSHVVHKRMLAELRAGGVEAYPYYEIRLFALANRMNYRNHRKIVVIDGRVGFVGGLNVDDRYVNDGTHELFWRDTHLMIRGNAVASLQYIFISDWNSCAAPGGELAIEPRYFPIDPREPADIPVQIAESGPNSANADIMLSMLGIIMDSRERLYITTPYFIPNETIVDALKFSALSGVDVRLLVPGISDSRFVNAASCSYYEELLASGVRIYRYRKGFIHAKTLVSDTELAVVGSANMDVRSFELMFEVNALVFNREMNRQLCDVFMDDLKESTELDLQTWRQRSRFEKFAGYFARLGSPML